MKRKEIHSDWIQKSVRLSAVVALAFWLQGCEVDKKAADAKMAVGLGSASSAGGGNGQEGYRVTVYAYGKSNCVSCHGANQKPVFAGPNLNQAYNVALGLVNFADIATSKFVVKSKDGHCGGPCSTNGKTMMDLIGAWKAYYDTGSKGKGGGAPGGTVVPTGNVFTPAFPVPAPDPARCNLPQDLSCSPEGIRTVFQGGSAFAQRCTNTCWTKIRIPLHSMSPAPPAEIERAWFEMDFAYESYKTALGSASYVVKNPRLVVVDQSPIYIFDVKLFLNGEYRPKYASFLHYVDKVVDQAGLDPANCNIPASPARVDLSKLGSCIPATTPLFSTAASGGGIIQERESLSDPDTIGFSFEYLQKGIAGDCKDLQAFSDLVYGPIKRGAVGCLNCHLASGAVSEAGQRFNMDDQDPKNGATANDRLNTVCKRFLQRSNFQFPEQSPIIVQPKQGLNGMPPQDNFGFFSPDWLTWIQREAALEK